MELPKLTKSNTELADPNLEKLRNDNELPRCRKSMIDIEYTDPTLVKPQTATDDPRRENDRNAILLPRWKKSSTDAAPPTLTTSANEIPDPRRAKFLIDNVLPS
jgi:hypothetical protein